MKILKVIHGYPPAYNAGSEVYTQMLCQGLSQNHEVHVFTREENPFASDYTVTCRQDAQDPRITLHTINIPLLRHRYRYCHDQVDLAFDALLKTYCPDIIHVGHLNHMSTSLLEKAHQRGIPIVFTLHDYWLICPRGQFIQRNDSNPCTTWTHCSGQEDSKCATQCYAGYFSGNTQEIEKDVTYWTHWVERRRLHIKNIIELVDVFIAPAQYLFQRFEEELFIPKSKLIYLDYGFNLERLKNRTRLAEDEFVFGYIGTHTPQKGIHLLLNAFRKVKGNARLRIWGRPRSEITTHLQNITQSFPSAIQEKIEWHSEYSNPEIVTQVFNKVDAIVVPSIWVENSPLVIHEAQQVGVPVITADVGGMAEYVHHNINGRLFTFRDEDSLAAQMQALADNPKLASDLGKRRYLYSDTGDIPPIRDHIQSVEALYQDLLLKTPERKWA